MEHQGQNKKSIPQTGVNSDTNKRSMAAAAAVTAQRIDTDHKIDDQGTDQSEASAILKHLRDSGFDSSDEKLAVALGRPTDEIVEWIQGRGKIDADVLLKAKALAIERGIEIE